LIKYDSLNFSEMPGPSNFSPGKDWMIGNVQQFGFYRVNYENNNWLALIKQLQSDHKVSMVHAVADDYISLCTQSHYVPNLATYPIPPLVVNTANLCEMF
jgi:hypothetical protein